MLYRHILKIPPFDGRAAEGQNRSIFHGFNQPISVRTAEIAPSFRPDILVRMNKTEAPRPLAENIATVVKLEERFLQGRTAVERIGDAIGSFAGSMSFVVLHVAIFSLWFLVNTRSIPGLTPFDPFPFILLSMVVSVEAVLLSTFVLMKQNREGKRAEHRQQLTLQIDLLAEQEATKTLQMLRRICERLGVQGGWDDTDTKILSEDTAVDELADELKKNLPGE
jgi:uncharacterized membrane protein